MSRMNREEAETVSNQSKVSQNSPDDLTSELNKTMGKRPNT